MQRYDVPTAVTFLFAGLGLGAVLAILLAPRPRARLIRGCSPSPVSMNLTRKKCWLALPYNRGIPLPR